MWITPAHMYFAVSVEFCSYGPICLFVRLVYGYDWLVPLRLL